MIVSALEAGLTLAEFWRSTPRQTDYAVRAYRRRRGWLAWHSAALARVPEMPPLHELTGTAGGGEASPEPGGQSAVQMLHNLKLWKSVLRPAQDERNPSQ